MNAIALLALGTAISCAESAATLTSSYSIAEIEPPAGTDELGPSVVLTEGGLVAGAWYARYSADFEGNS